ncbi:hypothetical protein L425_00978 [Klebsiella quasipneumoniae subsp. quasipneumoniae]|nr:hypothetical protein L425_00978 [Klebsiella quasipneumoniae subsp. quasipneumoniae]
MDKDKAESLLKDLHEFSRGFIKMDFIYLSALGAVLAYFKIDGNDVYKKLLPNTKCCNYYCYNGSN